MLDDDTFNNQAPETTGPDEMRPEASSPETSVDASSPDPDAPVVKKTTRKAAAKKAPAKKAAAKKTAAPRKTAATKASESGADASAAETSGDPADAEAPAAAAKKAPAKRTRKAPARKTAAAPAEVEADEALPLEESSEAGAAAPAVLFQAPEKTSAPARRTRKKAQADPEQADPELAAPQVTAGPGDDAAGEAVATTAPVVKKTTRKRAVKKVAAVETTSEATADAADGTTSETPGKTSGDGDETATDDASATAVSGQGSGRSGGRGGGRNKAGQSGQGTPGDDQKKDTLQQDTDDASGEGDSDDNDNDNDSDNDGQGPRRRRRRGGRRRRKAGDSAGGDSSTDDESEDDSQDDDDNSQGSSDDNGAEGSGSRRRRRRRRSGDNGNGSDDDPENTVTRVRQSRTGEDQITAVTGSTRLEAKKQRRREGREAGRRRAPIVSEAEFLARREAVERVMVIRQREELTQIAVLEDKVLVEHYVARESQTSLIGNVYVGRVQNVLPSMEAAFVDIGKGRNAVIYAGEVNWAALGHKDGQPRKIESVLSSGQSILVQVTKDPIGHKGARLTGQVSLAGRFLVYVPDGTTSGISRKLPDTERSRLKSLLKEIVPDTAGVIVRTAAEGASEDELTQDVERLKARWEDIEAKASGGGNPRLLYGEPDLTLKVVRDLFTEDFTKLVIEGDDAWEIVQSYVSHVAPDLESRLERYESENGRDSFATYRIDEQIAKGLDRKVWLPSGGSLIIDRTEAMTVVDVNTGKFTGSGGNLEETVTKNNLEAAEEIVRQLRLRDIGGIIVVDFIDMVLESNRDLVLRRLVECLGRDRTRHQVAEVTSLGLVQMTRKRIGTGLLEAFSEDCAHCQGRGLTVSDIPIEPKDSGDDRGGRSGRRNRGKGKGDDNQNQGGRAQDNQNQGGRAQDNQPQGEKSSVTPSPKDVAAVAKAENADKPAADEVDAERADENRDQAGSDDASGSEQESSGRGAGRSRSRGGRGRRGNQDSANQDSASQDSASQDSASQDSASQDSGSQDSANQDSASQDSSGSSSEGSPSGTPPVKAEATPKGADAPQAAEPAAPTSPKVVTRTRRKASRPAGVTAAPAEAITVAPSAPQAAAPVAAPTEAPKVVTRTRGRGGASRPVSTAGDDGAPSSADEAPGADVHVPIKKKGSRKH